MVDIFVATSNLTSSVFLKVNCSVEGETISWSISLSMDIQYQCILQSIGLSWTLSGSFTHALFLSSVRCVQNVGCELCNLSMLSPFIIQYQKIIFVNIPLISSEKSVQFEAVKLMVMGSEFSNIWIFPWKLKFYHWQ